MDKEAYFTPETIDRKVNRFFNDIVSTLPTRPIQFHAERAALLVLDMQQFFADAASHAHIPAIEAILPRVDRLATVFSKRTIFTRHGHAGKGDSSMDRWWKGRLLQADEPMAELIPLFMGRPGLVLRKTRYDAFQETGLTKKLLTMGVNQVVISGVMTHLCCETTARSAFVRGFDVFFVVDATATYQERFHRATLLNLAHGFAVPVRTRDIITWMEAR